MHAALEAVFCSTDPNWTVGDDAAPLRALDVEARLSLGNGLLGLRGARDIGRAATFATATQSLAPLTWPRCYVAGLFDTPESMPAVPMLMSAPDWTRITLRRDGKPLFFQANRTLDLRRSLLLSDWQDETLQLRSLRLVSQADRNLALQVVEIAALAETELELDVWCDSALCMLQPLEIGKSLGVWRSVRNDTVLAISAACTLWQGETELQPTRHTALGWSWTLHAKPGERLLFVRQIGVARGVAEAARAEVKTALCRHSDGWQSVLAAHESAWAARWAASDIRVVGDEESQRILRFVQHHLLACANPHDRAVSIGARGLSGDGYLGHVFWDTELYMLPFFIATWPEAAKALLLYRHGTLAGARHKARAMGYQGAMFAWESADTGVEETPDYVLDAQGQPAQVLCGRLEQHITADIAHGVWSYVQATGDEAFLREAGLELLVEIARFWASRVAFDAAGRGHINGVIGPDEYHEGVDDNAFTNVMAANSLRLAAEAATLCPEDAERLGVTLADCAAWQDIASRIVTGQRADGIFDQYQGFLAAPPDPRRGALDIKQADVVALLATLPDLVPRDVVAANFDLYAPRTGHTSSLSRPVHALVASRLGRPDVALAYFRDAAKLDLDGPPGSDAAGLHMAALGGLWQAAVLGFGGVSWANGILSIHPHLPHNWQELGFTVQHRGRAIAVQIDAETIALDLQRGAPLDLSVLGHALHLDSRLVVPR